MLKNLWNDDNGIVALEYLLVATIIGLSLVVGLHSVSNALNTELIELANAITSLDQTYSYAGISTCGASKNGSAAADTYSSAGAGSVQAVANNIAVSACP